MDLTKFRTYLKQVADLDDFAQRCGTTTGHLRNIAGGRRPVGEKLSVCIERESNGDLTRRDLRDDWHLIWPELVEQEAR